MTVSITVHRVAAIEFNRHSPDNSNAVTLVFPTTEKNEWGGSLNVEITLFDLPKDVVDKLYSAFGTPTYYSKTEVADEAEAAKEAAE